MLQCDQTFTRADNLKTRIRSNTGTKHDSEDFCWNKEIILFHFYLSVFMGRSGYKNEQTFWPEAPINATVL